MIDGLLLDSGNPTGTVKELGGTGENASTTGPSAGASW